MATLVAVADENQELNIAILERWAHDNRKCFNDWKYLGEYQRDGYEVRPREQVQPVPGASTMTLAQVSYSVPEPNGERRHVKLLAGIDGKLLYYATVKN